MGNGVDGYRNLCFYPAGREGKYTFRDDLGNEIAIRWEEGHVTAERISGETPFEVLDRLA